MDITILLSLLSLFIVGYTTWTNAYEYNTLAATMTSIGGNEGTIMIASEQAVTDNLIIPANITLRFLQGGTLNVSVGKTVTINGHVDAGEYQIFNGLGTVAGLREVKASWFGVGGGGIIDDTLATDLAIAAVTLSPVSQIKGIVNFANSSYVLGALAIITEGVILDFHNSTIIPATDGSIFTFTPGAPYVPSDFPVLKNATVYAGDEVTHVVRFNYLSINSELVNFNMRQVHATHSLVFTTGVYGVKWKGSSIHDCTAPHGFHADHSDVEAEEFSNQILLSEIDISNHTGIGVYFCGGIATVENSIIEACSVGGILHGDDAKMQLLRVKGTYFEANPDYDIKCGVWGLNYEVKGNYFGTLGVFANPDYSLRVETNWRTSLVFTGNTLVSGGVGGVVPRSYVAKGNVLLNDVVGHEGFGIYSDQKIVLNAPVELTIAVGGIDVHYQGYITVDGEGDAADNLDTINGGYDGMELTLRCENVARVITVRDGIGNIELQGGANMALTNIRDKLYLFYDATAALWVEKSRFTG